jgi:prepilin-type processing-associated H-X9-DG protein
LAFSRVDLLVVTGVILLVALVWMPAPGRTRLSEKGFHCLSNLRQLMSAMLMYTHDYRDFFPPNPDDGNTTPYYNWCPGEAGPGQADEFNTDILKDPTRSLLVPYITTNVALFHCPADNRVGRSTAPSTLGQTVLNARSFSMSGAVGTNPYRNGNLPVDGPWLNGAHTHTLNGPYFTYGGFASILRPSPSMLFLLMDENPQSLNDASFAVTMVGNLFQDCPGILHNLGCNLAFADGHCELKRWNDPRIAAWPNGEPYSPINPDVLWLQQRTSAPK